MYLGVLCLSVLFSVVQNAHYVSPQACATKKKKLFSFFLTERNLWNTIKEGHVAPSRLRLNWNFAVQNLDGKTLVEVPFNENRSEEDKQTSDCLVTPAIVSPERGWPGNLGSLLCAPDPPHTTRKLGDQHEGMHQISWIQSYPQQNWEKSWHSLMQYLYVNIHFLHIAL